MKVVVILIAAALGLAACNTELPSSPAAAPAREGVVTRVVDGDTIRLGTERVRLIGVDTPETNGTVECFGPKAAAFTTKELDGEAVTLELDRERRDRYGRLLAYVRRKRDGFFVNRELLARGYAEVLIVRPNDRYERPFRELDGKARRARRGRWGACGR